MWPERGEALNRTIEAEAALTDLYIDVLNAWVLTLRAVVLPELAQPTHGIVAAALPPDPNAVDANTAPVEQSLEERVIAGLAVLWALSAVESSEGMDIELPDILPDLDLRRDAPELTPAVSRAIVRTTEATVADVERAVSIVVSDAGMRQARDDFLAEQREHVMATPVLVRNEIATALRDVQPDPDPVVTVSIQRGAVLDVLTPGSEAVRDIARLQGYQAAGVQNAAVVEAAARSGDELEKTWIATLDGRTRHTHFAADGQRVALSGTFSVGAAQLRYPADPEGPPAEVRNCRCRVGVLAPDEAIPNEVDRHTERLNGRDSVQVNRQGSQRDEIERRAREGTIRARDDEEGIGRTAAGAPSEQEYGMDEFVTFTDQPIAFVGIQTSDGRMLADGIKLDVRTPPLPLMWCKQSKMGHMDAYTVGVIESAAVSGDRIVASGYMLDSPEASDAFYQASKKVSRPSVDLAATEWMLTDENGKEITEEEWWELPMDAKVIQTITAAELIGTTLVATPAFGDTMLEFDEATSTKEAAIVASAAESFRPRVYPAALFAAPKLTEPTLPQMDPDTGRIFGHLACFGECHRSIQSQCVIAPRTKNDYGDFHTSPAVLLDDGTRMAVGRLTVGTGHASDKLSAGPALAHYDNTGSCWALVHVYETEVGIEFSGVAAPWATPEQIEMGLSAPLSGDWRDRGNGLELIAALSVNTPGFAVRGRTDDANRPVALVASLGPAPTAKRKQDAGSLSLDDIRSAVREAFTEATVEAAQAAEIEALMAEAEAAVGAPPPPKTPNDEVAELLAEAEL